MILPANALDWREWTLLNSGLDCGITSAATAGPDVPLLARLLTAWETVINRVTHKDLATDCFVNSRRCGCKHCETMDGTLFLTLRNSQSILDRDTVEKATLLLHLMQWFSNFVLLWYFKDPL